MRGKSRPDLAGLPRNKKAPVGALFTKPSATLNPATLENLTTRLSGVPLHKAVLTFSLALVRLIRTFSAHLFPFLQLSLIIANFSTFFK